MSQAPFDTYVKVRLDRNVFTELEQFSQLRNVPKSTIASIAIKQLLEKDARWQMKQFFYAPYPKSERSPEVGKKVNVAFDSGGFPHFASSRVATVLSTTDRSFKAMIDIKEGSPYATSYGEGMDLSSGLLIEPEATEGSRAVFELPNEYAWAVE